MPIDQVPTSNLDEDTDSPKLARADLLTLVQHFNAILSDAWLLFTNDPIVIAVNTLGSMNFSGATSQVRVVRYGQDETNLWTISKADTDCVSTYGGSVLSITSLNKDAGYVTVTATRGGYSTLSRRLLVTRSIAATSVAASDPTPPPDVTGFSVLAGINALYVSWNSPSYTQGRGNAQTNIYGATYTGVSPPIFSDLSVKRIAVGVGYQSYISIPTEPSTKWVLWAKYESKDGYESVNPAPSAASGVTVETSVDIDKLLTALTNKITTSELSTSLSSEIALISAPSGVSNSVNQRLAALSSSVQASSAVSFEPLTVWDFESSLNGWTASGASVSSSLHFVTLTSTGVVPLLVSPALSIDGAAFDKVRARIRRTAGSGWAGVIQYSTSTNLNHGYSSSYQAVNALNPALDTWVSVEWDMSQLSVGWNDWTQSTISGVQIQLGSTASDIFLVDWVSIGRVGVGANYAALEVLAATRAEVDGYLGSQFAIRTTIASDGRTVTGGMGINGTSVSGQGPTIDFGVMSNTFWVAAPSGSGVDSVVPFTVLTTDAIDPSTGQLQPKGVYIDSAYIKNLSALWARFGTLVANSIQAVDISTERITLGSGVVGTTLKSSDYNAGLAGWMLNPNGTCQFPAASILGQLTAAQIDSRGLSIRDALGNVVLSAGVQLGSAYADSTLRNSSISVVGGSILGIGTGAGTLVANSQISITPAGSLVGAGGGQVSLPGIGHTTWRAVSAGYQSITGTTYPVAPGLYKNADTSPTSGIGLSYIVNIIRRSDGALISSNSFDLLNTPSLSTTMAAELNATGNDKIVIVRSYDEPQANRLTGGLLDAMLRCGASSAVFGSSQFRYRSAYILVGIGGCGEGNGFEAYSGSVDSDPSAWCDVSFSIINGNLVGVSGAYTPRSLADYGYTGDLNATNGATWGTNVFGRPGELTDGRITTAINSSGVLISRAAPGALAAPGTTGLYLGSDFLGYWNATASAWKSYMDNSGRFYLAGSGANGLQWDGATLTINGNGVFSGSLSAATGTFGGTVSVGSSPAISGTTMTGSGFVANTSGTFAAGNADNSIVWDGTTLTINKAVVVPPPGPTPLMGDFYIEHTEVAISGTVTVIAGLEFRSNGTIYSYTGNSNDGYAYYLAGHWYSPVTTGIGAGYNVIFTVGGGDAAYLTNPAPPVLGAALSSDRQVQMSRTWNAGSFHNTYGTYTVQTTAGATVGSGTWFLEIGREF